MENISSSEVAGRLAGLSPGKLLDLARAAVRGYAVAGGDGAGLLTMARDSIDLAAREPLDDRIDERALADSVVGWQRLHSAVHGEQVRRIAAVVDRRAWVGRAPNPAGWLVDRLGLTRSEARGLLDAAAAVSAIPTVAGLLADGALTSGHVTDLARTAGSIARVQTAADQEGGGTGVASDDVTAGTLGTGLGPSGISAVAETTAVALARLAGDLAGNPRRGAAGGSEEPAALPSEADGGTKEVRDERAPGASAEALVVRQQWREALRAFEHEHAPALLADRDLRVRGRRRLWVGVRHRDGDLMGGIDGDLAPTTTAKARSAVHALARKTSVDDTRSFAQRCHDAFDRILDLAMASGELPDTAGDQPRVLLMVEADTLHDRPAAPPALLDGYGPVSAATARQICCDAEVTAVARGDGHRILNVGRDRRQPNRAQRRAAFTRDQACIGCGAELSRCQIHHIHWWSRGGRTDIDLLVAVCWDCHAKIHHCGWQVVRTRDGRYRLRPPDGLGHPQASPPTSPRAFRRQRGPRGTATGAVVQPAPRPARERSRPPPRAPDQPPRAPDQSPRAPDQSPRAPDQSPRAPDQSPRAPGQSPRASGQRSLLDGSEPPTLLSPSGPPSVPA